MTDRKKSTAPTPENTLSGAFLERFADRDEASTVKEAESAGAVVPAVRVRVDGAILEPAPIPVDMHSQ